MESRLPKGYASHIVRRSARSDWANTTKFFHILHRQPNDAISMTNSKDYLKELLTPLGDVQAPAKCLGSPADRCLVCTDCTTNTRAAGAGTLRHASPAL